MFGGERFAPIIGKISLAHDMKTALQEADEAEPVVKRDAKGREIISPEEKARRDEKQRRISMEVKHPTPIYISPSPYLRRKLLRAKGA